MNSNTLLFYKDLPRYDMPAHQLLREVSKFNRVPTDWYIVVADIEGSTKAVRDGLHDSVNLAATGSIIAVLNKLKANNPKFKIPYFFGGDGATFLVPPDYIDEVMFILNEYTGHVKKNLYLTLRAGSMQVIQTHEMGHDIKIAKLRLNPFLTVPIVLGLGLKHAESEIKKRFETAHVVPLSSETLNLTGMECRWDEITPESSDRKVVCLIVNAVEEYEQAIIFSDILHEVYVVFGPLSLRAPVTTKTLKLNTTLDKMKREMKARLGTFNLNYLLKNWLITIIGKYYFKFFAAGKKYLFKVTQLSDTLMIDGAINTVMAGNKEQVDSLRRFLDRLETEGKIVYGMHTTYASIMSCYVQDRENNHIHFVDGTEGGYTSAATFFKAK